MRMLIGSLCLMLVPAFGYAQTPKEITNSVGMKLVLIPSGSFTMGSAADDEQAHEDERQHEVQISKPFYMGATEVTQGQYKKVMGTNPSKLDDSQDPKAKDSFPVDQVSWTDAAEFCKRLTALNEEKQNKRVYRLPTEAEWEYACRASTKGPFSFESDAKELQQFAWYGDNSGDKPLSTAEIWKTSRENLDDYLKVLKENRCRTHPVAQKKPNAWGLYDMHG